jgi:hypothetical protein
MPVSYLETGVRGEKLLQASVVLVGRLDSIKENGNAVFDRYGLGTPIDVVTHEASIKVLLTLNEESPQNIRITNILSALNPAESIGLQGLEKNTSYVFFLSGNPKGTDFAPISPYRFALKTVTTNVNTPVDGSLKESLAMIAKENIAVVNNPEAESWARLLQMLYDSNRDWAFWTNAANDLRMSIRGIALVTLSENVPQTSQLYSCAMKFIESEGGSFGPGARLCRLLPKLVGKDGPPVDEIKKWLNSKSKDINIMALEWISKKNEVAVMTEVVHLMTSSNDRDIQYACIKTLFDLTDNPHAISYPTFLKQPDDYIKEWKEIGEKLAQ